MFAHMLENFFFSLGGINEVVSVMAMQSSNIMSCKAVCRIYLSNCGTAM